MKFARKGCRFFIMMIVAVVAVMFISIGTVYAKTESALSGVEMSNKIMATTEDADMYSEPDENAAVVMSFSKGSQLLVVRQENNAWYLVQYQKNTGYMRIAQIGEVLQDNSLNQEMQDYEEMDTNFANEVNIERNERIKSRIWGGVICALIIIVFVYGIFSSFRAKKRKKSKTDYHLGDTNETDYSDTML